MSSQRGGRRGSAGRSGLDAAEHGGTLERPIDLPPVGPADQLPVLAATIPAFTTDLAYSGGRWLTTAQVEQAGTSDWYAHEVLDGDTLDARAIVPEPCAGGRPCGEVYSAATVAASAERVVFGSTRSTGGDSARVTPFGCP